MLKDEEKNDRKIHRIKLTTHNMKYILRLDNHFNVRLRLFPDCIRIFVNVQIYFVYSFACHFPFILLLLNFVAF